ncbi:MAG TPA: SDR family oxidoreductase [Acidisarcina sp.]
MNALPRSLIIGASGQVGHHLVEKLGENRVIRAGFKPRPGWMQIDLSAVEDARRQVEKLAAKQAIDAVYCVGGATSAESCESAPDLAMRANYLGPAAIASVCTHIPFIYFSTEYVFDGLHGPYTETAAKNPLNQYGRSKSLGEDAIMAAHPGALVLRTTVVYGDDPGGKNFLYPLRMLLADGRPMLVPSDQISTPTYNCDLAEAAIALVKGGHKGIFNVSGRELLSRYEFAVQAAGYLKLDPKKIIGVPTEKLGQAARRPLRAGLLIDKLEATLPGLRMRPIAEGMDEFLSLVPENPVRLQSSTQWAREHSDE